MQIQHWRRLERLHKHFNPGTKPIKIIARLPLFWKDSHPEMKESSRGVQIWGRQWASVPDTHYYRGKKPKTKQKRKKKQDTKFFVLDKCRGLNNPLSSLSRRVNTPLQSWWRWDRSRVWVLNYTDQTETTDFLGFCLFWSFEFQKVHPTFFFFLLHNRKINALTFTAVNNSNR